VPETCTCVYQSGTTAERLWKKEYVILFGFVYTSDLCDPCVADGVSLVPMTVTLSMVAKCASSAIFIIVYFYTRRNLPHHDQVVDVKRCCKLLCKQSNNTLKCRLPLCDLSHKIQTVMDDRRSQWGMAKFDPQPTLTPEPIDTKCETRDYVADIYH